LYSLGKIRFWSCKSRKATDPIVSTDNYEDEFCSYSDQQQTQELQFYEWELKSTIMSDRKDSQSGDSADKMESTVDIKHYPLAMSCSYNGRFAVAYKREPESNRVYVEIYECESTGGSGWKLEDVLCLEAPVLPPLKLGINLDYIWGDQKPIRPAHSSHSFKNILLSQYNHNAATSHLNNTDDSEIPSAAIRHSIKSMVNGYSYFDLNFNPLFSLNSSEFTSLVVTL
jgi:hypothetical protein